MPKLAGKCPVSDCYSLQLSSVSWTVPPSVLIFQYFYRQNTEEHNRYTSA